MPDITCPECGTLLVFESIQRAADEFCPHCDYPLFWAPSNVPVAVASGSTDATLRRLPGAGGRRQLGTKVCPECGEHNALALLVCIRCGSDLDPKAPAPEPEPEPVVLQVPPPPPPPAPRRRWWPWVVAAAVVLVTVVVVLVIAL